MILFLCHIFMMKLLLLLIFAVLGLEGPTQIKDEGNSDKDVKMDE